MSAAGPRLALACLFAAAAVAAQPAPLPSPDLGDVEPAVRRQLEEGRRVTERALAGRALDPAAGSEETGQLGRLYLLYSLLDSARTCFEIALEGAPDDPRWNYYLAVLFQRRGLLDPAAERLGAVLEKRPRDLPALLRRGQIELGRDRSGPAAGWFQRALEIDPTSTAAVFGLAQVAVREGELDQAVRLFTAVLEAQPEASTAHYQLGTALRALGDLDGARFHLARQGRSEVTFPDPLMEELGTLARGAAIRIAQATRASGRGDLATAQAVLESAVATDPANLTARLALASNLIRQGHLEAATAELERVLERDPDNAAAHYNLGTAAARRDDTETAIHHLRRATELAAGFTDAYVNLGALLRLERRYDEAVAAFDRALALEPGNVALELQRAEALHRAGRVDSAAQALAVAAPKTEDDAALLLLLGQAHQTRGDDDAAAEVYSRAAGLTGQPEAAEASRRLAAMLATQGRGAEAIGHLDQALALRPDWDAALAQRARLYGQQGRYDRAAADYSRLTELAPLDEGARMGLAIVLLLTERYHEAAEHLEESVRRLPESVGLRHTLARMLATCPDDAIRDGTRALSLAQEVAQRSRRVEYGETIAMALAELGRFGEAVSLQRQLLDFARSSASPRALAELGRRLARYERGEAERAPWLTP